MGLRAPDTRPIPHLTSPLKGEERAKLALAALLMLLAGAAWAQAPQRPAHDAAAMWAKRMAKAPQHAVSAAFDETGRLWLARATGRHLTVSHSDDAGASFSAPLRVNAEPEAIDAGGENRPKIAVAGGRIHVSWTTSLPQPFAGHVRYAHSADGGASFSAPLTINSDASPTSHRFDALLADAAGRVSLVWLDKRDGNAAKAAGGEYAGAAVYAAQSQDGGRTFAANRKLADHSCECCRIALAADRDGTPVAFWRHVFDGGVRDFAIARLDAAPQRASEDGWRIDACPHHGGAIAIDAAGGRHLAWFTGAEGKAGLYYRRVDASRMTAALAFGNPEAQPGHPAVLAFGEQVLLAWNEYDGSANHIRLMTSADRGDTWSAPQTRATSRGAADYPQLLAGRGKAWLAWNTAAEGLRLFALETPR